MSYDYKVVEVIRVVDGDTLDVVIDVGFRMTTAQRIRLAGIDTPERGQPGWAEATELVRAWCRDRAGWLRITTTKADSFGRYLGDLYAPESGQHLVDVLLAAGYPVYRQ